MGKFVLILISAVVIAAVFSMPGYPRDNGRDYDKGYRGGSPSPGEAKACVSDVKSRCRDSGSTTIVRGKPMRRSPHT